MIIYNSYVPANISFINEKLRCKHISESTANSKKIKLTAENKKYLNYLGFQIRKNQ